MTRQMTIEDAVAAGALGQRAALARAEKDREGWGDIAFVFLKKWARERQPGELFTGEDISDAYAADANMPQPADQRAWGPIIQRATRRGVITAQDNKGVRRKGHGSKGAARYRSLICGLRWTELEAL